MTPAEQLRQLHLLFLEEKKKVEKECETLPAATALMRRWPDETRLVDAISAEAKKRAIARL